MLFNSIEFLLFFPAVVLLYYAIPGKLRVFWILLTSYLFYITGIRRMRCCCFSPRRSRSFSAC